MTLVEFFDGEPLYDVAALLALSPTAIVYVGTDAMKQQCRERYECLMRSLGKTTVFSYYKVDPRDPTAIVSVLEMILDRETDCVFDVTGGTESALLAVGMLYERHKASGRVCLCHVNLRSGRVKNAIDGTQFEHSEKPQLTIAQSVSLHGGVIGGSTDGDAVAEWVFTAEFCEALKKLWKINAVDPSAFNKRIVRLCEFEKYRQRGTGKPLSVSVFREQTPIDRWEDKIRETETLLRTLEAEGLVTVGRCDDRELSFSYCCEQVKRCLSKAGNLLELLVLAAARSMTDKNEDPVFNDSLCGVHIDWDGSFGGENDAKWDTLNEIDVCLMNGLIPVFVSCKNGTVGDDELYKLSVVADRFGGPFARAVLVGTYIDHNPMVRAHLEQRAKAMGITLVADLHRLNGEELMATLSKALK